VSLKIAIISRDNGVGLTLDAKLLTELFTSAGHDVAFHDWQAPTMPQVDVALHLELVSRTLAKNAEKNIALLNLEWYPDEWMKYLPAFSQIWAKSRYAYEFCRIRGARSVHLTGFLGQDRYDPQVPRKPVCLHLRGRSTMKGTDRVIEAWRLDPTLPHLTIVSKEPIRVPEAISRNITVVYTPSDRELDRLLNEAEIHLCPSVAEGWGHYITEGMSTGAVVITTDASPMNEHIRPEWGYLLGVRSRGRHHQAEETFTAPEFVGDAVRRAMKLEPERRREIGMRARQHFLARNKEFRATALRLVKE
jgi:glycosyltransferase involved in cell wall biosynthesis